MSSSMLNIKRIDGTLVFSTQINVGSKLMYTLMKEHYITLKFSVENPIYFRLGDYVDLGDYGIFELIDLYKPDYNTSTGGYDYTIRLDAYYWKWKNKIFKYTPEHFGNESVWSLTAPLETHLNVFLNNLSSLGYKYRGVNFNYNISGVSTAPIFIEYSNCSLIEALNKMADAITNLNTNGTCEWWITGNTINFGKCENGSSVNFEVDSNVSKMVCSGSSDKYATRLFVFGGTQNIPLHYRKKLIFTVTKTGTHTVNGVAYDQFQDDNRPIAPSYFNDSDIVSNTLSATLTFSILNGLPVKETHVCNIPLFDISIGLFYIESLNVKVGDTFTIDNIIEYNVPDSYFTKISNDIVNEGVVQDNLMLPEGYECIDSDGLAENNYKGTLPTEEYVEQVLVNDEIYPHFDWEKEGDPGSINSISRDDAHYKTEENGAKSYYPVYTVEDVYLKNFKQSYITAGKNLHIIFQSGLLAGFGFDVNLNNNNEHPENSTTFEIVPNETYGRKLPDYNAYPVIGDTYVLTNYNADAVSESLTPSAEQQLLAWGIAQRNKMNIDPSTYTCTMQSGGTVYGIGQKVTLHNDGYFGDGVSRESRIIGLELNLDIPNDSPIYTVGESTAYSRIGNLENKLDELQVNGKTYTYAGGIGSSGSSSSIYVISSDENTEASEINVFSAKKSLNTFLRKDKEDSTSFLIHFLKGLGIGSGSMGIDENGNATLKNVALQLLSAALGINIGTDFSINQLGEAILKSVKASDNVQVGDYQTGLLGKGAKIDSTGAGEMRSLTLWESLTVPKLEFNRVEVLVGMDFQTKGGGLIDSVTIDKDVNGNELNSGTCKLHLEDGEFGAIAAGDLCMGIFHNFGGSNSTTDVDNHTGLISKKGFNTSYFEITEITDTSNNGEFKYILRNDTNWPALSHPQPHMNFAQRGNTNDATRQSFKYRTTEYSIGLTNVNSWEFGAGNIYYLEGNIDGWTIGGKTFTGTGVVIGNAYIFGSIDQFEKIGYTMSFDANGDFMVAYGETKHIKAIIKNGYGADATSLFSNWTITRNSGDTASDNIWNASAVISDTGEFDITWSSSKSDLGAGLSTIFAVMATKGDKVVSGNLTF